MDTDSIWTALASIPIGTIVGWIVVAATIIGSSCAAAIKLYKAFDKYKSLKDKNAKMEKAINEHENKINEVDVKLQLIITKLESQDETTMKKLRRDLVKDGEAYLVKKEMTIREFNSWMEMFDEYHNKYKQNSYVETLKHKIEREVSVVGKLDDHGDDIE